MDGALNGLNVLLIYYTGTYNTRFLAKRIKEYFVKLDCKVDLIEVDILTKSVETNEYDLIGIGYPIYAFNSPKLLNKYLRKISKLNKPYFIFKNSGETYRLNNSSSRIVKRIMRKKKYELVGEYHYVMPYNIHFPYEDKFIKEILKENDKLMAIMMNNLATKKIAKIRSNLFYDLISFLISIQKIGGIINSYFYRIDKKECIDCGLCIKNCPTNNIYMKKNKIRFHHHCMMCMRCSFFCPKKAISIGFLNSWKVVKYYDLEKIEYEDNRETFITNEGKGFYKCFIRTFNEIDEEYGKLLVDNKDVGEKKNNEKV